MPRCCPWLRLESPAEETETETRRWRRSGKDIDAVVCCDNLIVNEPAVKNPDK